MLCEYSNNFVFSFRCLSDNEELRRTLSALKNADTAATVDQKVSALELNEKILGFEAEKEIKLRKIIEKDLEISGFQIRLSDASDQLENTIKERDKIDQELRHLQHAVSASDKMHEQNQVVLLNSFENRLKIAQLNSQKDIDANNAAWELKLKDLQAKLDLNDKIMEATVANQRGLVSGLLQDKREFQKSIETALEQVYNKENDVVDRKLVVNLMVSYFKKNR